MNVYACCVTCFKEEHCETFGLGPDILDEHGAYACSHWCAKDLTPDNVNHPSHYETGKFECFDVMVEALGADVVKGFCLGNAFKYLYRCMKKHASPREDVAKAQWYLNHYLELEDGEADV